MFRHRHNQELEQDALATEQEKAKLQQAADNLAEQLDAILHDRIDTGNSSFDADTPIDKTMKFLQGIITVRTHSSSILPLFDLNLWILHARIDTGNIRTPPLTRP